MFEFVDDRDDDFDVVDIDDGDVVDSRTSFFLTLENFDNTDDNFDTKDIDDGDDVEKKFVDKREDIVEGVEQNGRGDSTTNEPLHGNTFFFSEVFDDDLPTTDFLRGGVFTFDMIAKK